MTVAYLKFVFVLFGSVLILAMAGCSTAQTANVLSWGNTACHVATAAEAADPVFVSHNPKVVANVSTICTSIEAE